jgi:hypothetical protein
MFIKRARNRWEAFGWHLVVSFFLFLILSAVIYFFWYPGVLFKHDGGLEGIKLIASVDFFIGPVLTLLVYKLGKKSLPFDLACIGLLQIFCLAGGMWTVWQTRPVAIVYAMDTFRSIPYQAYRDYGVNADDITLLQGRWPVWLGVKMPIEEQERIKRRAMMTGMLNIEVFFNSTYYVPFDQVKDTLASAGRLPTDIVDFPAAREGEYRPSGENIRYFLAGLGSGAGYLAVDTVTGEAVDFVPSMPREKSLLDRLRQTQVMVVKFFNGLRQ